jgi:predicted secreted protein
MRLRNRLLADIHQEMVLTREEVRLSRESREEMRDDMREFMRETTIRVDRMFSDLAAVMHDQAAAFRELASEVREGRDEQRAQTQALMRLIDRMDRIDPGGAAA